MNKSIYNNKIRAAKRRIWEALKREGIETNGVKHKKLISIYFNMNDIQRPIEMRWQEFIIKMYDQGLLGGPVPIKKKENNTEPWRQKYNDYLISKEWRLFRSKALDFFGNKCALCDSTDNLHLHHKHYKNLYNETFADVIPLCRTCHKRHHRK